jgi:hypothetical protein
MFPSPLIRASRAISISLSIACFLWGCRVGSPEVSTETRAPSSAPGWSRDAAGKAEAFLAGLFDPSCDLLPEYRGSETYWLYHDNYLAAKLLERSRPELSARIRAAMARYGVERSGKIELLFDEAQTPFPFLDPELVTVAREGSRSVRTEVLTERPTVGWESYADLLLMAAIARAKMQPSEALGCFARALALWDGRGFADAATRELGRYSIYKLALALIAAERLGAELPMEAALLDRLRANLSLEGGWITDYTPDGVPCGLANVETTCLVIMGLEAAEPALRR